MRKVITALVLLMTALFSGCEYFDNTPGSFHIKFEWNEVDKPDFSSKDYYAWVLLEEWPEGDKEKAILLMQTAASRFDKTGKVSIDLTDLKYGDNRVVKVEIRGSEKTQDRVLYFGRSELFSFSSKDRDKEVKVAMQTGATPGTGGDGDGFSLQIVQNGAAAVKINSTEVSVRISAVKGNRVIISNSLSILEKYLNDKKSVMEGFADKLLSELKEVEGGFYDLEKWDLNKGLEIAEDAGGERIVYGKLLNDDGYMSETVQVSVLVDKTPPGIINPAVTPNPAKLGDIVTAVFSFTEPVDIEKLDIDWDGLSFSKTEGETTNVFTYTFEVDENTEERSYGLEGRAFDQIGNGPVTFTIGNLIVDRTLPEISDQIVSVTDDKQAVKTGDTITATFKVSEDLEKSPEVTVDGKKFERVGDSTEPYTFKYTVADTDIEGLKTVLVSLSDLARNQNVVEMEQTVKFDLSAPAVINPTVTPAGEPGNAGLGAKIEVRFNISEPVTELKFLVNGSESELFSQSVDGLTYSYTRTVENNESSPQYVFSVSAVDAAGNTLEPYTLGTVAIDVGMPSVLSHTLSKTNVKLLEVFTLDLQLSEELKSITVLTGSKDISSGCVKSDTDAKKYLCTHTANADSDEGDGVKQFSVQMTDMSGNSSTVQLKKTGGSPLTIEYDVTPPAVVNPVIAPSKANSDSTVDVRFSFTEDVENVVMAWDGLEFIRDNSESDKKLFIYKHKVTPADEEKSYTIKILEAFDIAGNPISSEIEIGTVEIDNTPPEIFNTVIKVSDDPLRTFVLENEMISISFEVKEDLSDYAVRIGLKKLSVCISEDITAGKRYTCTYSTPSADDGEGTKDVTVEVKDLAGNGTSYPIGQLTYDMSAPQLSSTIVIPEKVNSSTNEVKVQFSFSEDVQINVDEVYVVSENFGPELMLNCNTGSGYSKQFLCTYSFLESDTRVENYNVSVDLRDTAGNEVTGMFIGKIESDRQKPYLSAQNITPVAVRQNEQFTVTFTVNEELAAKPVVKIGDKQIDESSCTGSINYTCQHKANEDSDETDGVKSVTVNLRDPAGNTSIITLSKTVTYDATRPELLNPVIIPEGTANRYNSTVQVRFSFSEKINYPSSFDFTVVSAEGGSVPAFNCTPANANHQSFSCETVFDQSDETDDTLTFKVNAADIAGNALTSGGTPVEVGILKVDRKLPDAVFNTVAPLNIVKSAESVTVIFTVDEELSGMPAVNIGSDIASSTPSNVSGFQYTYIFNDLSLLSDGSKQISVFITDKAGNMKTVTYSENITVDRSAPSIIAKTIAPSIANLNTGTVAVNFTFSEKISSFNNSHVTASPSGILTDYSCENTSGDEQNFSCVFNMSTAGTYDGVLTFSVSATDKSGNPMDVNPSQIGTLTVDRNAPELTFDSILPLLVNNSVTSVTVQFTVDKVPDGSPVVKIGTEKALSTPFEVTNGGKTFKYIFDDLSGISDGNKNIIVELKDDAGNNVTGTSTEQIFFDRLAPSVVSKNIAPSVVNKDATQITISFTFSEKMTALTNGNVTVAPAGLPAHDCTTADNQSYSCTVDVSLLGNDKDGTYTYSVSGSDQYGNPMSSATIGTVTVDRSDLGITFGSATPSVVINTTASVSVVFTLSETPLENPVVKLAGTKTKTAPSNVSGLTYTYTFNDLAGITDGEKGVTISVKDSSGNLITEDFTGPLFDRTTPSVVSKNIAPSVVNKDATQITISFTFSEKMTALTNGNVTVAPAGLPAHDCTTADNQSYSCTVDVSLLGNDKDGTYTYSVSGSDQYGNPMSSATIGTVTVDRSDLDITFGSAAPSVVINTTASVSVVFTLSETPLENPVVKLAGTKTKTAPSNVSGLTYTYTFNDLAGITDGEKGITITVKDGSGNSITEDFAGPLFDRTEPILVSSNTTPLIVNKLTDEIIISFTYSEKMSAWSNANLTVSPSGNLPSPVCSTSDSQSYLCSINTSALGSSADGPYTFSLTGTDQYGNPMYAPANLTGVTVDRTDPSVSFVSVTPLIVKASTASLTVVFTVSETLEENPLVTVGNELSDNSPYSVSGLQYTYVFNDLSLLSDGFKTVVVQVTDLRRNTKDYTYGDSITVDRTLPSVLSSTVAPSIANEGTSSVTLSFAFSEKIQGFVKGDVTTVPAGILTSYSCVNSSGDEQTYSCVYNTSSLGDYEGSFTFRVEAEDKSGNPMAVNPSQIGTLTVDRNAPELTFDSLTPSIVNIASSIVTVVFTVDDVPAGNPVVKIGTEKTKSTPSSVTNGGKTFTYIFSDLSGISDGSKNVTVDLQDGSGNPVSAVWSGTLKFDRTAPQMISSTVAPSFVNKTSNTLNISFSYSEPMAAFVSGNLAVSPSGILPAHSCSAIDGNNQTITCTVNTASLDSSANGFYTFTVTGTDVAGNPMESAATAGFTEVDRTSPGITLNSITPETVNSSVTSVTVVFTVTETLANNPVVKIGSEKTLMTYESVAGLQYTYKFTDLAGITDGPKTLNIQVKDVAQNIESKDFTNLFFDRTAPAVVSSGVNPAIVNLDVSTMVVSFAFNEVITPLLNSDVTVSPSGVLPAHSCTTSDNQSYQCAVNVGAVPSSSNGSYTYFVKGTDASGNQMSAPVAVGSTYVDKSQPVISLNSFVPLKVISSTANVTVIFTLSETPESNPVVKLATKQKNTPSSVSGLQYTYIFDDLDGITDGDKTISISMKDLRGNPASKDFAGPSFDRTAPTLINGSVSPAVLNSSHNSIVLYMTFSETVQALTGASVTVTPSGVLPVPTCTNPGGDLQSFQCSYNITELVNIDNTYTFKVTAKDTAGNSISPDPATVTTVKIDKTLPGSTLSAPVIYDQGTSTVKAVQIARAGDVVVFSTTVSELLKESPKMKLGGAEMILQGANCFIGTCTFARVIQNGDGDGSKHITVEMEDEAGNTKTDAYLNRILLDVSAPEMHSNFMSPQYAKLGDTIEAKFKFSEPVDISQFYISSTITFTKDTGLSTDTNFVYTATVTGATTQGTVSFWVATKDIAGNWTNGGSYIQVGSVTVDRTTPSFSANTCDIAVSSGYTNPSGIKAVKAGQTVTANCNITANETIKGNPVLKVGGYAATRQSSCPGGYNNCYLYTVAGTEGDGNKVITTEIEDLAGNITAASTGQQVSFDFTGPQLVSHIFDRYPLFSSARDTFNKTLYLSVKDPYSDEFVQVSLSLFADEDINSSLSVVIQPISGTAFDLGSPSVGGNVVSYAVQMSDSIAEGLYNFKVTWSDMLGNSSTQNLTWKLYVDKTEPQPGDIDEEQMIYRRFPYGNSEKTTPFASVEGGIMSVPSADIEKVILYSINGQYLGDATVSADGSFNIPNLYGSNASEVYVNPVKYSGIAISFSTPEEIPSVLPRVPNVEWTANLNDKVTGLDWPNPHSFYNRSYFTGYLSREGDVDSEETDTLPAQSNVSGQWRKLAEPYANPLIWDFSCGRMHGAAAYDSIRGYVYVFGGEWSTYEDGTRVMLNDLHRWDGFYWEIKGIGGALPPARRGHGMVYDINRDKIIVFGGEHYIPPDSIKRNDMWEWNGEGWSVKSISGAKPSERVFHCMAYDRKRAVSVVFGGDIGTAGVSLTDQTWEFNGTSWTQKTSAVDTPDPRYDCQMTYSEERGTVLMYGGTDSSNNILTDLWEWNGTEWTALNAAGPAFKNASIAWDPVNEVLYLAGGRLGSPTYGFSNQTWIWSGSSWTAGPNLPLGLEKPLFVYNAGRQMMMINGGIKDTYKIFTDTLGLVNGSWVVIDRGSHPESVTEGAAAYDSVRKKIVMFGGNDGTSDISSTWEFDGVSWTQKSTALIPPAGSGHAMAYMSAPTAKTVMYTTNARTYTYNGTTWTYAISGSLPGNREHAKMVFDSARNVIVLFGGGYEGGGGYYYSEGTYEYNGTSWTKVCGSGVAGCTSEPSGRTGFAFAYDAKRGVSVLFGGTGALGETWEWSGTSWTQKTLYDPEGDSNPPGDLRNPEMFHHSESGNMILIGGDIETDTFVVWKYNGISYELIDSTSETYRSGFTSAYFGDNGFFLVHGGKDVADEYGDGTLLYNVGKYLRPAQIFSVKTDTADIPDTARIEDVTVKFSGGANGFINNEKLGSIAYEIFYGGAWISLGDIDHDTANTDDYSFTVNNRRLVEGMRFGNRDSINIAFRSTAPSEGIWNDSKVKMNNIEMKVRYNLDGDRIKYPKYGDYYISSTTATWQNARNDCINRGGDLLILNSAQEQAYVESLTGYVNTAYYWTGFHDIGHDLEWRSVSGTHVWQGTSSGSVQNDSYVNWYTGYPTASTTSNCAVINKSAYAGKWYNSTCTTARPYICELNRENSYMISTDMKTWDAARTACIGFGGDLVTIDGYNEQKELEALASGVINYWLGFTDRDVDGVWRWVTGSNRWNGTSTGSSYFYANWYTSFPYSGTSYQYASFYGNYKFKWNTPTSTSSIYYICEFESPQFCSLNDDACTSPETCCSELCNTDNQECVNCIDLNYHGCDVKADCCDGNPCNIATDQCVTGLNTGEKTCEDATDCTNTTDSCISGKCCRLNHESCSVKNDCCNSYDTCYNSECCRPIGTICRFAETTCCFGECVGTFLSKTCECRTYNTSCSSNSQCCSNRCIGSVCLKGSSGAYCYTGTDCSSGSCYKNKCQ